MQKKKILSFLLVWTIILSTVFPGKTTVASAAVEGFKDVKTSSWYYTDVMYAKQIGFMKGYGDNTFKPNNTMDVSTFIELLMRTSNVEYSAYAHSWMISESRATKTTPKHIVMALYLNIIKPGEFKDYKRAITRGEMCRLINRVLDINKTDYSFRRLTTSFFEDKANVTLQIKDYTKMDATEKKIAYNTYASGIVTLHRNGAMELSKKATRAEIISALIRLGNPYYRIVPTVPTTPKDMSNTITVEGFTTQLLKAIGKKSTMKYAYTNGFVRAEADYPSYKKPILRREAALIVARLMDDITNIDMLFTRGGNEVFIKGVPTASTYPDIEELFVYPSPIWTVYDWENYRGNISDIYQITEEYQKEMVTLYLAGFIEVDKNKELRPYDFLTKEESKQLINKIKEFAYLNPKEAQDKLQTLIRDDINEKAMPSIKKPSNAKLWGETYPYVNTSLYEYVKNVDTSWGNHPNIYLYKKNSSSLKTYPQVFKNYLNTRYTVDYRTLTSKTNYYSKFNDKGGTGDYLKRVLFFYNPAHIMNRVQTNNENTPKKDCLFPDDVMKKEIANIKKNKIVMQSEAITHKSLLFNEEADQMLVTLRTIYYPGTSESYLKSKGLETGIWYEQDILVSMVISIDGPEAKRDRWENSLLGTPYIDELSPIRKMK